MEQLPKTPKMDDKGFCSVKMIPFPSMDGKWKCHCGRVVHPWKGRQSAILRVPLHKCPRLSKRQPTKKYAIKWRYLGVQSFWSAILIAFDEMVEALNYIGKQEQTVEWGIFQWRKAMNTRVWIYSSVKGVIRRGSEDM